MQKERIRELYKKYMEHEISEEELDELAIYSDHPEFLSLISVPLEESWSATARKKNRKLLVLREKGHTRMRIVNKKYYWSVAAAVVIVMSAFALFWKGEKQEEWVSYQTGYFETLEVLLEDGSSVILNAGSELRWKKDWEIEKKRLVKMFGEAYFDVSTVTEGNEKIPFEVRSGEVKIEVHGTAFNVESYGDETNVFLEEGRIRLDPGVHQYTPFFLEEGEKVQIGKNSGQIQRFKEMTKPEAASWTEGELRFRDVNLGEILPQLGSIYGKKFEVEEPSILEIPLDFGVPYANWELVKQALEIAISVELLDNEDSVLIREKK